MLSVALLANHNRFSGRVVKLWLLIWMSQNSWLISEKTSQPQCYVFKAFFRTLLVRDPDSDLGCVWLDVDFEFNRQDPIVRCVLALEEPSGALLDFHF